MLGTVLIKVEIQFQDIYPRLTQESKLPLFRMFQDELPQPVFAHATLAGDTRNLEKRRCRGDVRIES